MSSSFSSKNNSVLLQQDLDEFAQNVLCDLTKEEQELVSQLTSKAAGSLSQSKEARNMQELDVVETELSAHDGGFQADEDELADEDDDYLNDFE